MAITEFVIIRSDEPGTVTVVGSTPVAIEETLPVIDRNAGQVLIELLGVMKKLEYHLSLGTDVDLKNTNL